MLTDEWLARPTQEEMADEISRLMIYLGQLNQERTRKQLDDLYQRLTEHVLAGKVNFVWANLYARTVFMAGPKHIKTYPMFVEAVALCYEDSGDEEVQKSMRTFRKSFRKLMFQQIQ